MRQKIKIQPNQYQDVVIELPSGDEALALITLNASLHSEHHGELTPPQTVQYWESHSIKLHSFKLWHQDLELYIDVLGHDQLTAIEQWLWDTYDFIPSDK